MSVLDCIQFDEPDYDENPRGRQCAPHCPRCGRFLTDKPTGKGKRPTKIKILDVVQVYRTYEEYQDPIPVVTKWGKVDVWRCKNKRCRRSFSFAELNGEQDGW